MIELTRPRRTLLGQISVAAESFMTAVFRYMDEADIQCFIEAADKSIAAASRVKLESRT